MTRREWEDVILKERARQLRWSAKTKATVTDPKYGKIVVPCLSPAAAAHCAAELWGADPFELSRTAEVWAWEPGDGPTRTTAEYGIRGAVYDEADEAGEDEEEQLYDERAALCGAELQGLRV